MRFAIITEEILLRRRELLVKNKNGVTINKNASETLFLYVVILLHSWRTGICDRTIPELCQIHGLDKQNSYRRLRILRDKGWIEDTKKYIKPILTYRADQETKKQISTGVSETVIITPEHVENPFEYEENFSESVIITPETENKSVIITPQKCNDYTFELSKSVIITPQNDATINAVNDYSRSSILNTNINNTVKPPTTGGRSVGGDISEKQSEFSTSECLRWANKRKENGERIENPLALAQWAYKTGDADDFIYILLYPHGTDDDGRRKPRRIAGDRRGRVLRDLRSLSDSEFAVIEENWRETYTADDWAWIMEQRNGS